MAGDGPGAAVTKAKSRGANGSVAAPHASARAAAKSAPGVAAGPAPAPRTGLYPGTFDPITNGHLDIIWRAAKLVDRLVIGVAVNRDKAPLFSLEERVEMLEVEIAHAKRPESAARCAIEVRAFDSLLMKFAEQVNADVIVRGLRAVSDFEYEFQMVGMNQKLNPSVETVFLMADPTHQAIASRLVKEIARLGGDVRQFVPGSVEKRLQAKFGSASR